MPKVITVLSLYLSMAFIFCRGRPSPSLKPKLQLWLRLALIFDFTTHPPRESIDSCNLSFMGIHNHCKVVSKWKTTFQEETSQEDNLTGRRPHWKTTYQEDDLTGKKTQSKMNSQKDNLAGRQPQRNTASLEDKLIGRRASEKDYLTGR